MAKLQVTKGTTSKTIYIFIQDSSSSTGAGLTGLVYNSAGLTAYYIRPGAAAVAITLATQTVTGAYSSGGFVEVSSANVPGIYRLDLPNAVLATGVDDVVLMLKGATNMAPLPIEIQLTDFNLNSSTNNQTGDSYAVVNNGTYGNAQLVRATTPANTLDTDANGDVTVGGYATGQAPLQPTTAGRSLDVTVGGAAGIDWGNVENPTTVIDLSGTNINLVDTCTTNTDMRGTDNALLASSAPANFSDLAITLTTGQVTVGTNTDKVGYTISGTLQTLDGLDASVTNKFTEIKGATWSASTDTLEQLRDRGDAAWVTGNTVAPDNASIALILADTSDIQPKLGTPATTVSEDIANVKADTGRLIDGVIQANTTGAFHIQMLDASNVPVPSQAVTVERRLDNGAFSATTGTATTTDVNGVSFFSYAAVDVNGTDAVAFKFTATGAEDTYLFFKLSV